MSNSINLFTIGFTQKTAQQFFDTLVKSGVKRVVDTRLNNISQLAGFTKRGDLEYFLRKIGDIEYVHILDLAPTKDILDDYKKNKGDWETYENKFLALMRDRQIEQKVSPQLLDGSCLLCSEAKPHHCHRRLVAEYLRDKWGNITISHL
ncbi:hypothetical protein NIES37_14830 [Tolypothrix tenuis PCC 7101]|uniref:DUF488 domain-containing protein n=1 Tax=Tolypothrix tenuis PCC 7101 TaxID=231146 RepID=A0A1Z4MVT9_9CYAN|nr:DUF488 domain-containing protein [Aulosira sp. FACHB-113]BAY97541.1 hypothetical protein NIES37_14830 [Tolypothrix tenuis PCC 7101]BAZ71949.1 hypothetical protein NIES50_04980 [Aulosira laxa NIES-50]